MVGVGLTVGLGTEGQPEVSEGRERGLGFSVVKGKERKRKNEWIV